MALGKVARAYLRGQAQGCGFTLLSGTWVVFMIICMTALGLLLKPYLPRPVGDALAVWIVAGVLASTIPVGYGFAALMSWRRNRRLDRALTPHGETRYLGLVDRGWHGMRSGRELHAWFMGGPKLEIYLTCAARNRGSFGRTTQLARAIPYQQIHEFGDGFLCRSADLPWMRRLTEAPGVHDAVKTLLEEDGYSVRTLDVQPDALHWTARFLPLRTLNEANTTRWIEALQVIAEQVDQQPAPAEPAEASYFEERLRTHRSRKLMSLIFGLALIPLTLCGAVAFSIYAHFAA